MTESNPQVSEKKQTREKRGRRCLGAGVAFFICFMLLFIILLILALTVFKTKQPRTQLVSATIEGVAPRISFPAIDVQLNITLDLQLLVENRNHASFKHGPGKSLLLYQGNQVGEADIPPGFIPAMGSTTLPCRLTLQIDEMVSNMTALINDILDGQLVIQTRARIPGRVNFLGIFKKHAVATSECQFTIAVLALKVQNQTCRSKTKL